MKQTAKNAYQALLLAYAYQNKFMSSEATAANNGRRIVRDGNGKYHVVFESGITSGGEVLSEIFYRNSTDGITWSTPIRLSTGNEKNRYPSITQFNNKLYAVWQRKNSSNNYDIYFAASQYDHSIIHRKTTDFDTWPSQYYLVYYFGQRRPSLTALSSSKVDLIFQHYTQNSIYKMRFDGSSWSSSPAYVATGSYPSVSTGSTQAKYVYTSGSIAPYTVNLSTETLQKTGSPPNPYYSRSVAWLDRSGAYLEIIVDAVTLKLKDGTMQPLDFAVASLDSFKLTTANAWAIFMISTRPPRRQASTLKTWPKRIASQPVWCWKIIRIHSIPKPRSVFNCRFPGRVTLAVYDVLGKRLKTLFDGRVEATMQHFR